MGVGGCRWPSSANVSKMVRTYLTLMKIAPNFGSTTDDVTNFKMVQRVKIAPLSVMGYPSLGTEPRKKWTDERLLEFLEER